VLLACNLGLALLGLREVSQRRLRGGGRGRGPGRVVRASSSEVWLRTRFEGRGVWATCVTEDIELGQRKVEILDGATTFSRWRRRRPKYGEMKKYYGTEQAS
jgi:hypothetical protein